MSIYINNHNGPIYEGCNVTINNGEVKSTSAERVETQDVEPVDTSFFCTARFAAEIIEKNLREAIASSSSKADVCRRIMAMETQGYILLSNVKDDRKAELINPFAAPKYTLHGDDFRKARNS